MRAFRSYRRSGPPPQEKGGSPEDARLKGKINMPVILESRAADNSVQERTVANFSVESAEVKAGKWLASLVKEAKDKGKPVSRIVDLTPALAQALLNRNPNNRQMMRSVVEQYAHDIAIGAWEMNGEPVIVSDTGELNDGQHRCQAVLDSGSTIPIVIIVGVPRETRMTLNRGRARTVGDYLAMDGHSAGNVLGAVAMLVWMYNYKGYVWTGTSTRATKSEILEVFNSHKAAIKRSVDLTNDKAAIAVGGKTVLAFCHYAVSQVGKREDADHFILSLMHGAGLKVGNPMLYARNRIINERGVMKTPEKVELIFRAWNAWRTGAHTTRLWLQGSVFPALEP